MVPGLLIAGGVGLAGLLGYSLWQAKKAATESPSECEAACDLAGPAYGAACKLGCKVFNSPAHLECPPGFRTATDHKAGSVGATIDKAGGYQNLGATGSFGNLIDAATKHHDTNASGRESACVKIPDGPPPPVQGAGTRSTGCAAGMVMMPATATAPAYCARARAATPPGPLHDGDHL